MTNKNYYLTAWILDGVDLLLGIPSIIASLTGFLAPVAVTLNNLRGIIYDSITIPIVYSAYGGKSALIDSIEVAIPEEIDMLVPIATIAAYTSKDKK